MEMMWSTMIGAIVGTVVGVVLNSVILCLIYRYIYVKNINKLEFEYAKFYKKYIEKHKLNLELCELKDIPRILLKHLSSFCDFCKDNQIGFQKDVCPMGIKDTQTSIF